MSKEVEPSEVRSVLKAEVWAVALRWKHSAGVADDCMYCGGECRDGGPALLGPCATTRCGVP